jgi:small-conductance mechanosensitive channel
MFDKVWPEIAKDFQAVTPRDWLRAALVLVVGLVVVRLLSQIVGRLLKRNWSADHAEVLRRATLYVGTLVVLALGMRELGIQLSVLLGAAGVLTVAVGFAAQTSLSNAISGFLLFGERPFRVGDVIQVEKETGEVVAIDLLSTKLRTFTNQYVRIPNETMFKNKVVNLTHYPIRRLDLRIPVAYGESLDRVRGILLEVAERNVHALAEPPPLCLVDQFGDASLVLQFSVWAETGDWLAFLDTLTQETKRAFEQHGVRAPATGVVPLPANRPASPE